MRQRSILARSSRAVAASASRQALSTAAASPPPPTTSAADPPPQPTTTNLIRNLKELLHSYPVLEHTPWPTRLEQSLADVESRRRARIAVVGEAQSGTSALVTAAFDDPLEADVSLALASRRLGEPPEAIKIFYSPTTQTGADELGIPSHWLKENQTDILEIVHQDVAPLQTSISKMYASDTLVLLVSEHHSMLPPNLKDLLQELRGKPNLVLVVNTETPTSALRHLQLQLQSLLPDEIDHPTLFAVSTSQAMDALLALTPDDGATPPNFEAFQAGYVRSGIVQLKDLLQHSVQSIKTPSSEPIIPSALQLQTARFILDKSINVAGFAAAQVDDALEKASSDIAALAYKADDAEKRALADLNVVNGRIAVPESESAHARRELSELLSGEISWWKLPFRSDDITLEIAFVVETAYLRSFEDQILFQTGSLVRLLHEMSHETDSLFTSSPSFSPHSPPLSSLHSPLLTNLLARKTAEAPPISTSALSSYISQRRSQITSPGGPAEVLQARAQAAVGSASVLASGSVAAMLVSDWMQYADLVTNTGVGLFGTMFAAWLLQRRWDGAKKKFFVDVEKRVTGGLEDDLGMAAQRTIDEALLKTRTAVSETTNLLKTRQVECRSFAAKLALIEQRRKTLV